MLTCLAVVSSDILPIQDSAFSLFYYRGQPLVFTVTEVGIDWCDVRETKTGAPWCHLPSMEIKSDDTRVEYFYLENIGLVDEIKFKHGSAVSMKTKKEYDRLNRLQSIESKSANDAPFSYLYQYNQANQRTVMSMDSGEQNAANKIDTGISIVGSLGAGVRPVAIRVTKLSSTSISTEVVNASFSEIIGYCEVGQLSLSDDAYTYYSLWGNTINRGAAMVADQGWKAALFSGSKTLGVSEGTLFSTGLPTPLGTSGASVLAIVVGQYLNYFSQVVQPVLNRL